MNRRCLVFLLFALAGCQTTPLYDWGHYEDSVLLVTTQPDGFELDEEINTLEIQLQETANKEARVPPGLYAHLGWLLQLRGDVTEAGACFRLEKELFPESAFYMDQLLQRMEGPGAQP